MKRSNRYLGLARLVGLAAGLSVLMSGCGTALDTLGSLHSAGASSKVARSFDSQNDGGNTATLFVSPVETLPAVKDLINGAQRSIYFETFNFGNDSYGQQLVPLLIAKARAGLDVRVNMDYLGSRFIPRHDAMVKELQDGGVQVLTYSARIFDDAKGNHTISITHRKCYMADGERALVGGVNLKAPFDTTTEDLLIKWEGPIVAQLYKEYAHDWTLSGGSTLAQAAVAPQVRGTVHAHVAVTSPGEGRYEARNAIFHAIEQASQEIEIQQQYLWDDDLLQKLHAAVLRGVHLRIMVPNGEQKVIQKTLNVDAINQLVKLGAEARFYRGITPDAHLHTKYFSVDNAWAITGSVNGDTRSLIDNQELDVVTTDPGLVGQLKNRLFERDWSQYSEPFVAASTTWATHPFHSLLDLLDYYF